MHKTTLNQSVIPQISYVMTYIVITGATKSRLAINIPQQDKRAVNKRAHVGSPFFLP